MQRREGVRGPYSLKHLFIFVLLCYPSRPSATGPPAVNEDDEGQESAARHPRDQYNGCPVQAVRDRVEGSLQWRKKKNVRVEWARG